MVSFLQDYRYPAPRWLLNFHIPLSILLFRRVDGAHPRATSLGALITFNPFPPQVLRRSRSVAQFSRFNPFQVLGMRIEARCPHAMIFPQVCTPAAPDTVYKHVLLYFQPFTFRSWKRPLSRPKIWIDLKVYTFQRYLTCRSAFFFKNLYLLYL